MLLMPRPRIAGLDVTIFTGSLKAELAQVGYPAADVVDAEAQDWREDT